jgi:phosphatidylglycerol:prolipoprotein diacylglycerol transferase
MRPILLDLPSLGVRLYAADTMLKLGVLFCLLAGPRWAERLTGVDRRATRRALAVLLVIALIGGRLHFLLNYAEVYRGHWIDALKIWTGGSHIPGGIIALALAAPSVTRYFGLPLGRFADGVAPSIGIGIVIVRLGCFLNGCCFGIPCDLPWCLAFPPGSSAFAAQQERGLLPPGAIHSNYVHPLQLYFAATGLLITLVALWLQRRKHYDGQVGLVALLIFSMGAAGFEFLREGSGTARVYWGPLPQLEWTALSMVVASLVCLIVAEVVRRRTRPILATAARG